MNWRQLATNKWFAAGLVLRLVAIALLVPQTQQEWFVPFMRNTILSPSIDPWSSFLVHYGNPQAFPYGPVMYLFHLPFVAAGVLAGWLFGFPGLAQTGFALSLLTADLALLICLCRLNRTHVSHVIWFYWLSPMVIYITYWHGQTDVIPTLLLLTSLFLISQNRFATAGAVCALSIAAKLSAAVPLPFILLFLWKNRRNRHGLIRFLITLAAVSVAVQMLVLFSDGYRTMVLGNREFEKAYSVALNLSGDVSIYAVPTLYLLLLYWAWKIGRMNLEMMFALLAISYFLILLVTPAPVGWFIWVVPFLVRFQTLSSAGSRILIVGFSIVFVFLKLLLASGAYIPALNLDLHLPLAERFSNLLPAHIVSLGLSGLTAIGLMICLAMMQRALRDNNFFRLTRPLLVGIAGDSGSGKDTLSIALAGLFGDHSVVSVAGDDYHRFERQSPMWQTVTHLNPRANDLNQLANDCLALMDGKYIRCRHYDHRTGRFTPRQKLAANDIVLVNGLHAFYPGNLRQRMDLRIFLDMDEGLRQFFKIRRDSALRGHSVEVAQAFLNRRQEDYKRYIRPQMEHANVIFCLQPATPLRQHDFAYDGRIPLRLRIRLNTVIQYDELARLLSSLCGIQAEIIPLEVSSATDMLIEGDEISSEDVQQAALLLVPHLDELLDIKPQWRSGLIGVMQIVVLALIAERAKHRG